MIILKVKKSTPLPSLFRVSWEQTLSNSSIDEKISVLNETVINFINNCIRNKTKVLDDQNPPWMNAETQNLITIKNKVFKKRLKKNGNC